MLFQLFIKCFIISLPAKGREYVLDSVCLSVCLISTLPVLNILFANMCDVDTNKSTS